MTDLPSRPRTPRPDTITAVEQPLDLYPQPRAGSGDGWLGNVTAPLPTTAAEMRTTYSPAENVIHPCMVELAKPLLGYRYICAITAYPRGPALEDPFVYGSNDRVTWTFLGNTPQPLDVKENVAGSYNSDTFITHDPGTGELVVGYRMYVPRDDRSGANDNADVVIYIRRTRNGHDWTPRQAIIRSPADRHILLSPTVIRDPSDGLWHMWVIERPMMRHLTAPALEGPWSVDPAAMPLRGFARPHHHEVKWVGSRLACLMYSRGDGNLFFGIFEDGSWTDITWSRVGVIEPRPASLYKASFIPVFDAAANSMAFDIWWTMGALGPEGGVDNGLGRRLQYARTNASGLEQTARFGRASLASPRVAGRAVVGGTLRLDAGGDSIDGYAFNWQWNTDGGPATTAIPGRSYAPLPLTDEWAGRYVRLRYRTGGTGRWTASPFVGPVI